MMLVRRSLLVISLISLVLVGIIALAEDTEFGIPPSTPGDAKDKAAGDADKKDDKLPNADDVTKDMVVKDGFFRIYEKKADLYIEIPRSLENKEFFLATSFAGGNSFNAWQWSDQLVMWERYENKLLLVSKDVRFRAAAGSPVNQALERTYSDHIVLNLPIIGEGRGSNRGYLVDGKKLFAEGANTFFGGAAGNLDTSIVKWAKTKAFKDNCEIAVTMPQQGDGRLITLHYSLARLRESDYKPRVADPRIGYFLSAFKDFTAGKAEDNLFVRYVNRWNLQKKESSLRLSPPSKPIVFYVEKTVPVRFRRYVREGILEWNKAFEKIGFDGAIEVRQQTEDQFSDLDPEDSSLNFFRWITSETPFAMGPSRVNPRTGEILDADVIFDDSMARAFLAQYDNLLRQMPVTLFSPRLQRYFSEFPDEHPFSGIDDEHWRGGVDDTPVMPPLPATGSPMTFPAADRAFCHYGHGILHELAFAGVAETVFAGKDAFEELPEEFIGPVIREIVMHEIGHTLGLRHNFKASTWRTMAEINEASLEDATVASVMDYTPVNVVPGGAQKQYMTATIGPYDYWAIEYGYSADKDDAALREIAARGATRGLAYGTDEDVWTGDPTINRYDHSDDPLAYSRQRLDLAMSLLPGLITRMVKNGESYESVRRGFGMVLFETARAGRIAAGYVGGAYVHRDHKGDPEGRAPLVVVPAEKQREALSILCDRIFAKDAMALDPELLTHLAAGRWSHWGSQDWDAELNYPVLEQVLAVQAVCLSMVLNPETLSRLRNNELKVNNGEAPLTIPQLFTTLTKAIFSDLGGPITAARQNLQREYAQRLMRMSLRQRGGPAIVQALARTELEKLATDVEGHADGAGDEYTAAHLADLSRRIQEVLKAQYIAE